MKGKKFALVWLLLGGVLAYLLLRKKSTAVKPTATTKPPTGQIIFPTDDQIQISVAPADAFSTEVLSSLPLVS